MLDEKLNRLSALGKVYLTMVSPVVANDTFFSSPEFVQAWTLTFAPSCRPLAISVKGSGPPRALHAVAFPHRFGRRAVALSPMGLCASPGWENELSLETVDGILCHLRNIRTTRFLWTVRFDQQPLADALVRKGLKWHRFSTQILPVEAEYERTAARFNSTIRNQIRQARRRGVSVRLALDTSSVYAYYEVHRRLAEHMRGYAVVYPVELLINLLQVQDNVRLLIAEYEDRVIAGGLFIRDRDCIVYWHGASDRSYSRYFGSCAVIDEGVRWACECGANILDFGASRGIASLEQFKSFWGTHVAENWAFEWRNPFWERVGTTRASLFGRGGDSHA